MSLEAEAARLGIPMTIQVDDELRYSDCDAHMATLTGIEGKHAQYQGECNMGHIYDVKRLVSELQSEYKKKLMIGAEGKLVFGLDEGFKAGDLQEY